MDANAIWEFLQEICSVDQARVLIFMILANVALGTAAAIKNWEFEVVKFKDFIRRVGYIFVAYVGVSIAAEAIGDYTPLRDVTWGALVAFIGAQLIDNLKDLGLPVPEGISRLLERKG